MERNMVARSLLCLAVFVCLTVAILLGSYSDSAGRTSHDSVYYLRAAQNILNGYGAFVGPALDGQHSRLFSTWPLGYPTFVALTSLVFDVDVFWGSKICNAAIIFVAITFVSFSLRPNGYLQSLVFMTASPLMMATYSLSESAFVSVLIVFSASLARILETNNTFYTLTALLSAVLLVLIRYIGIFSISVIFLYAMYLAVIDKKRTSLKLLGIGIASSIVVFSYLAVNLIYSNKIGGALSPRLDTGDDLLMAFLRTSLTEINLLTHYIGNRTFAMVVYIAGYISSLAFFGISLYYILHRCAIAKENLSDIVLSRPGVYFITGLLYMAALVLLTYTFQIDNFNQRMFLPFVFMLLCCLVIALSMRGRITKPIVLFMTIAFSSALYNGILLPLWSLHSGNSIWRDHKVNILSAYKELSEGSNLFSRNDSVALVRKDLGWHRIYSIKEAKAEFLRICQRGDQFAYSDDAEFLSSFQGVERVKFLGYRFARPGTAPIIGKIHCSERNGWP